MKRFILMLMIFAVIISMIAGCASPAGDEETALAGDLIEDPFQDSMDDQGPSDLPQQNQTVSDDAEQEDSHEIESPSKDQSNGDDKEDETPNQEPADQEEEPQKQEPSKDQETSEPESSKTEVEDPDAEDSGWYKVASYNIKSMHYDPKTKQTGSDQRAEIARILRAIDADIVGLQEVDENNSRTNYVRQAKWLAEELGYQYYYFTKTVKKGSGDYGHAILSRFPIKEIKDAEYKEQREGSELRRYSRAVLEIDGKEVIFYNNHLCTQIPLDDGTRDSTIGQAQFREVVTLFKNEKSPALMTGDFNLPIQTQFKLYDRGKVTSMNGGKTQRNLHDEISIDNIYVNNMVEYYVDAQGMSVFVGSETASDHDPLWSYFKLK